MAVIFPSGAALFAAAAAVSKARCEVRKPFFIDRNAYLLFILTSPLIPTGQSKVDALAAGAAANMEYFEVEDLMEVRMLKWMIDYEDIRNDYNEMMDTR